MNNLNWDASLSVQFDEIDDDHHKLVELFNLLSQSLATGESSAYINAVFIELINFTAWHFSHEERLMIKYAYNELTEHKKEHQELLDSAKELHQKFIHQGHKLSDQDIEFLEHWLTGHIFGADMKLGIFLCESV